MKPGNIEGFYTDSTKGKVKDITVKEGQEVEKGTKLFSYDNEEINLKMKQAERSKDGRYAIQSKQEENRFIEARN